LVKKPVTEKRNVASPRIPPSENSVYQDVAVGSLAIYPKLLLEDFRQSVKAHFQKLVSEGENSLLGENF
jgi:hypothetical protein